MKRISSIVLMFVATAGFAAAQQVTSVSGDILGAHLNYGRGCAGCHAPHSGARGNGFAASKDQATGDIALWGEDVSPLFNQVIVTGKSEHGSYSETLPGSITTAPDVSGLLMCLSCHDGNLATGAMMNNKVYESLPNTYASTNIPTLLGNDGNTAGDYLNDHPVGLNAKFSCNTPPTGQTYGGESGYNWDCGITTSGTSFTITPGPNMAAFINNYGFFVSLGNNNGSPVVVCTTCHNQHSMNVVKVSQLASPQASGVSTSTGASGLQSGYYQTMFFIRAPYNPGNSAKGSTSGSNQTAQFCRQCHGGESNEMNGSTAVTTF